MPIINPDLPADGENADAADYNDPINAILGVLNGAIDADNLAAGAVTTSRIADDAVTAAKIVLAAKMATLAAGLQQASLINGKFQTSVSSNNLTLAIKTLAGGDPSSSDPVYVRIGNTFRALTSALSVTRNAGTNWFGMGNASFAAVEQDYFIYMGYNSTDGITLGFSRLPNARIYSDFSTTTTHENYAAISTVTNAVSADEYENVGRFNATLSAAASYNWSIPATSVIVSRPVYNRAQKSRDGFVELARVKLTAAGDTISVTNIPPRRYYRVYATLIATGGTVDTSIRFNNDSGTNYAHTLSANFGAAGVTSSATSFPFESGATDSDQQGSGVIDIFGNMVAQEKNFRWFSVSQDAAGAATQPVQVHGYGKWANTSAQINRVDFINSGTGDYAIGSELIIEGMD